MGLIGWFVIVPLAISALLTGVLLALATPSGLFRLYWVVISLALTALSLGLVLLPCRLGASWLKRPEVQTMATSSNWKVRSCAQR